MNHEFIEALDELEKDRGIDKDILIDTIEQALLTAQKAEKLEFTLKEEQLMNLIYMIISQKQNQMKQDK